LGYIYVSVKLYPPERWIHLVAGGPIKKTKKLLFVKSVFLKEKLKSRDLNSSILDSPKVFSSNY